MANFNELEKVGESITVNRYLNGWMVELSGRDKENDWKTLKVICTTEDEMISLLKEWNSKKLDD